METAEPKVLRPLFKWWIGALKRNTTMLGSLVEAARRLEMNEGAVKVAIHRLRRLLREVIKNEISQTVKDRADIELEMHDLLEALL